MITIDAQDKTLGRVASAAAKVLMGKDKATFVKHQIVAEEVTILNASKVKLTGTKERTKKYIRYSGYPGGQKKETYAMLTADTEGGKARRGHKEAIRRAILGMLPKNKLQMRRIKLLTIKN
ncbi:50S ribosomal protein L13 [Candidatus Adlerbacteria bacterium RIFCSPLOWO2_01_FULL_54_21b]|uniref:50S ribosomal protein L13 n=1 Tax=Candidatus Adlerbacteria bacterium RIFCSPLOWO2_01_FULL_54_21b TaxID=1797245 RepID=A0A1F4XWX0_9BACT|nr:MAG: 50S ribosomal protein L13 [Candidatus Adlerbacteria bacterium RIFCSPLOWO2_01_FULL_54_21b]